jgi:hypothetical protein
MRIKVSMARPRSPDIRGANMYVNGFPKTFLESDLFDLFVEYGEIIYGRILSDDAGRSRGIGFVRLDTRANAHKAMYALQGMNFKGHRRQLIVMPAYRYHIIDDGPGIVHAAAQNGKAVPRDYYGYNPYNPEYKQIPSPQITDPVSVTKYPYTNIPMYWAMSSFTLSAPVMPHLHHPFCLPPLAGSGGLFPSPVQATDDKLHVSIPGLLDRYPLIYINDRYHDRYHEKIS